MLEFDFSETFKVSQLDRLCSFLKNGVTFSVVAVKHSYVAEDPKLTEEQNLDTADESVTGASDKQRIKTSAKDRIKLEVKDGRKSAKTIKNVNKMAAGKEKGGKKDKRDLSELYELPQEPRTVGTCHVSFASFIDGGTLVSVSNPCVEEKEETENECAESTLSMAGLGKQNNKKKEKAGKGKAGKNDRGKSAIVASGKGNKTGKGKEKMEDLNDGLGEVEAPSPPPPLSIKLEVKLERFTCTRDVLGKDKS